MYNEMSEIKEDNYFILQLNTSVSFSAVFGTLFHHTNLFLVSFLQCKVFNIHGFSRCFCCFYFLYMFSVDNLLRILYVLNLYCMYRTDIACIVRIMYVSYGILQIEMNARCIMA